MALATATTLTPTCRRPHEAHNIGFDNRLESRSNLINSSIGGFYDCLFDTFGIIWIVLAMPIAFRNAWSWLTTNKAPS